MTFFQVALHWPPNVFELFKLFIELLFRTAIIVSLTLFAYRLLQTAWGVLKFLAQTLWQKFRKVLTVDDPGVGPVSSNRV